MSSEVLNVRASRRRLAIPSSVDGYARWCVFLSLLLIAVVEILGRVGFFADGAYFFYYILQTHHPFIQENSREGVNFLTQYPLIVALKLGVRSLSVLGGIWNMSLVLIPLGFWAAALFVLRKHRAFWAMAVLFAFADGSSGLFKIGEYNTAYALFACALALLLVGPVSRKQATLLVIVGVLSIASYPSTVYLGLLLTVLAGARVWQRYRLHGRTAPLLDAIGAALVTFALSSLVGLSGILNPQGGSSASAFNFRAPFSLDLGQFKWSLAFVFVLLAGWLLQRNWAPWAQLVVLAGLIVIAKTNPIGFDYNAREIVGVVLALGAAALTVALAMKAMTTPSASSALLCAAFVLWTAVVTTQNSLDFKNYLNHFAAIEVSTRGYITDVNGVVNVPRATEIYTSPSGGWSWGESFLSVDLVPGTEHAIVLNPGLASVAGLTAGLLSDQMPLPWPDNYTK